MGWRLRLLALAALLGCGALFLLARALADTESVAVPWQADPTAGFALDAGGSTAVGRDAGKALAALSAADRRLDFSDPLTLHRAPRWIIDDDVRAKHRELHGQIAELLRHSSLRMRLSDGTELEAVPGRLGFFGLGSLFWVLSLIALMLYLSASVMVLAEPSKYSLLYALMAVCQSANLVFAAASSTPRLGLPHAVVDWDMTARMSFDLATAAAAVQLCGLYAEHVRWGRAVARSGWAFAAALVTLQMLGWLRYTWWWTQGGVLVLLVSGIMILIASHRARADPLVPRLRHFGLIVTAAWIALTLSIALTVRAAGVASQLTSLASTIWVVFLASLLLLVPFFARSQQIVREFSLLAAVSTVATSLDLVFVAVFSFGQFASLTLSLFIALSVYAGARQWILGQLLNRTRLTTERVFERLYRSAREVEAHPDRAPDLMMKLLCECFDPIQAEFGDDRLAASRIEDRGATLVAPVPAFTAEPRTPGLGTSIRLRHAQRGRRRFSIEDLRLSDRVIEQMRRAVAFDRAVEQGRNEERIRIAQDLHDDIGARLLTLMYKAESPEMEEYLRHTLKDLKTLTRGLAEGSHRLSHAAAEWKADLTHRLTAADVDLGWTFEAERDALLSVVQWSALTRILRELVSNTIAHAGATRVEISFRLDADHLDLEVADDGQGREPRRWAHGLGLGGVRKRVKQLGGAVDWEEAKPHGIRCRARIPARSLEP